MAAVLDADNGAEPVAIEGGIGVPNRPGAARPAPQTAASPVARAMRANARQSACRSAAARR
jgi:hypothetical protein